VKSLAGVERVCRRDRLGLCDGGVWLPVVNNGPEQLGCVG